MGIYKGGNLVMGGVSAVNEENMRKIAKEEDMIVYSTDEVVIGTWVDGKPLYRKVMYANSVNIPTDSSALIDATLTSSYVNGIIRMNGGFRGENGAFYTMPYDTGANNKFARIFINKDGLYVQNGAGISISAYNFILEYTKA